MNPNSSQIKNKQLDDLSIGQTEEHVSASLARFSFFPHLLVYKVAICGLGRRLCASNQDLAYNLLLYLEQVQKQAQYLVQYTQEQISDTEDSDEIQTIQVSELPFKMSKFAVVYPCAALSQGLFGQLLRFISSFKKEIKTLCGDSDINSDVHCDVYEAPEGAAPLC